MERVKELVVEKFSYKGGENFTSLKRSDLITIIYLYDSVFFQNEIRNTMNAKYMTLESIVSRRTEGSVGVLIVKDNTYSMDVSLNLLDEYEGTHLDNLLEVAECFIIHIMMGVWGYLKTGMYSPNGILYKCMFERYFGEVSYWIEVKKAVIKPGLYSWWDDSCYMDSLFACLFLGDSKGYFKKKLLDADVSKIKFPRAVCSIDSEITTEKELEALVGRLQLGLKEDYEKMTKGKKSQKCTNIRGLMAKCIPEMLPYDVFGISQVYDVLADLFDLKMNDVPQIGIGMERRKPISSASTITIWDYMDAPDNIEGEGGLFVDWDRITSDIIVFRNGMAPSIENFDSLEEEIVDSYEYDPEEEDMVEVEKTITKVRAFGEYILEGKYRLFAAAMNKGNRPQPGHPGGGHYTAYIRPYFDNDNWYEYDDLDLTWDKKNSLPNKVFKETGRTRPELLFYVKL